MRINFSIEAESPEELQAAFAKLTGGVQTIKDIAISFPGGEDPAEETVMGEPLLPVPDEKPKKEKEVKPKKEKVADTPKKEKKVEPAIEKDPWDDEEEETPDEFKDEEDEELEGANGDITVETVREAANKCAKAGKSAGVKMLLNKRKLKSLAQLEAKDFKTFLLELETL